MRHFLSQAELIDAVEYWLNNTRLKQPVKVKAVEPENKTGLGVNYVLHVEVETRDCEEEDRNATTVEELNDALATIAHLQKQFDASRVLIDFCRDAQGGQAALARYDAARTA